MSAPEPRLLAEWLKPGDGVLDIGAHVGEYALRYCHAVGPTGTVLAIEPDPDSYGKLQRHQAKHPNLNVMNAAVGAVSGEARLYRDRGDARRDSLWPANVINAGDDVPCRVVTLDEAAARVPRLRAIKIDAQGAEADILAGGALTLQRVDLVWQVELWNLGVTNAGSSLSHVMDVFESHGWVPDRGWADIRRVTKDHEGHKACDVVLRHTAVRAREAA